MSDPSDPSDAGHAAADESSRRGIVDAHRGPICSHVSLDATRRV